MANTKPIAVATNDSTQSRAAVGWAAQRAGEVGLPLVILHVVDDRWVAEPYPWLGELLDAGDKLLEAAAGQAADGSTASISTQLLSGSVAGSLAKYSAKTSLLVVGSGSTRFGGSLADRALQVAAGAKCPVAVVGPQDPGGRHGVVVGVDGSEESTQAVAFAAAEADRTGQELTVVHAVDGTDRWLRDGFPDSSMADLVLEEEQIVLSESVSGLREDYPGLVVNKVLETKKDPATALVDAAAGAQLLVVGSRGRGGFKRLLLGSTAHAVLTHLPCPTVITRVRRVKHK